MSYFISSLKKTFSYKLDYDFGHLLRYRSTSFTWKASQFKSVLFYLKFKVSRLDLDYHARDKLLRLVGDRYDPATDILTLTSDR